jgi:ACS family D-galactonate transporter-like MFS transporter
MSDPKPTRARFVILSLLAAGTMINYLDRTVMGVAAPSLSKELGLTAAQMGVIFSAFSWSYAAAQIPGGIVLDRIGVKLTYFLSVTIWSGFTLVQGFATGFASLLGCRLGLGLAEAPCFPANSRVLSAWFPQQERARATGVFSVGMYAGIGFLSTLLAWIAGNWGWRVLLIVVGVAGIIFGFIWIRMYREPHESPQINQAELDYIKAGGGLGHQGATTVFQWRHVGFLLRQRQVLGAAIGQFAGNATLVFFLTWFPTYLATERHLAWIKVGFFTSLPFIAAAAGVITGGLWSDALLRRTGSANIARKLPIITGLVLAAMIVIANFVPSNALVITVMSVAFFGQGMVNLGWTLITDVAPKKLFGLTTGLFNFCTNLAGIVTPLLVGYVVTTTGSFAWALAVIGCIALSGALSYVFLVGDVRRVEFDDAA